MAARKQQLVMSRCTVCRADVWVTKTKTLDPARQTCGRPVCESSLWTAEEWQARARMALRRPPWRRGQRLAVPSQAWCLCTGESVGDVTMVLKVEENGTALLVRCCPRCERLTAQMWWDNPHKANEGDVSRWFDFEALRRYPDGAASRADWSLDLPPSEEIVIIPPRAREPEPAPVPEPPIEVPAEPTPEPDIEVRPEVPPAPQPVSIPEPDRPHVGDLALVGGELVPVTAVLLPDGSYDVAGPDGQTEHVPAVEPPAPLDLTAALLPPEPPAMASAPAAARQAPRSGPPLCLLAERGKDGWVSRCGRTVKPSDAVDRLPLALMTGWGSQVSCPSCLTAMAGSRAAAA